MRYILFLLLFSLPMTAKTTHFPSGAQRESVIFPMSTFVGKTYHLKRGYLKQWGQKVLLKQAKKPAIRSGEAWGKWLSIIGFGIGLLGGLCFAFSFELAVFLSFLIALPAVVGLALSIFGLVKASRWSHNRTIKWLAIVGIVLNTLLLIAPLILL